MKETADRVNESLVRNRVLAALDILLVIDRSPGVCAVLQSADPNPYRDAVRDALASRNARAVIALAVNCH